MGFIKYETDLCILWMFSLFPYIVNSRVVWQGNGYVLPGTAEPSIFSSFYIRAKRSSLYLVMEQRVSSLVDTWTAINHIDVNFENHNIRYVGYRGWLPPSPSSVPALRPSPHTTWPDRDRSGPDLDCSSSPKHGETELEQIQKKLGDPDLRPESICFHPSPSDIFLSSHTSSPEIEDQAP